MTRAMDHHSASRLTGASLEGGPHNSNERWPKCEPRRVLSATIESRDGNHWRMLNEGSPVLPPGPADAFDASIVGHACFLQRGDRLRVWYTGYRQDPHGVLKLMLRIGLAEWTPSGSAE